MDLKAIATKVVKDVFTENDGQSFCPVRVLGGMLVVPSSVALLVCGTWRMWGGHLSVMEFAQAVAVMAGVHVTVFAAGVSLKAMTDSK